MTDEEETLRTGRSVFLCALVGLAVGLAAVAFYTLIEWVKVYTLETFTGYESLTAAGEPALFKPIHGISDYAWLNAIHPELGRFFAGAIRFLLPGCGAFAAALIASRFSPSASGHGTDMVIRAYHNNGTDIPLAVAPTKMVTSALVIGTGGSAGCEGPVTQIGATLGAWIGRMLRLSKYERRILLAAGLAAGVGALFRAPMAGALFAAEIFYRGFDLEGEVLIPSMVASTIAYVVFALFFGWQPIFSTPGYEFTSPVKLLAYTALAFAVTLAVRFNILLFRQIELFFRTRLWPRLTKPLVGGLATGLIACFIPEVMGTGYGVIQKAMSADGGLGAHYGSWAAGVLFLLFFMKILATSFTVGSGGSGGLLGPALFCGAMLGAAVGYVMQALLPEADLHTASFAMVGMAAYLAAAVRTPIASILMVSEFTGDHNLLLPAMWVCGMAFLLTNGWTLYKSQVRDRESSPVHQKHQTEEERLQIEKRLKRRKNKKAR